MATSTIKSNVRFATETGTNNSWEYVKYSDGTYEAWRQYSGTMDLTTQNAGTYYNETPITLNLPSFSKTVSNTQATAKSSLGSGAFVYKFDGYTSTCILDFRAHVSASNCAVSAYLYIRGTY